MKRKDYNNELPDGLGNKFSGPDMYDIQEFPGNDNEDDNFYSFWDEDQTDLTKDKPTSISLYIDPLKQH